MCNGVSTNTRQWQEYYDVIVSSMKCTNILLEETDSTAFSTISVRHKPYGQEGTHACCCKLQGPPKPRVWIFGNPVSSSLLVTTQPQEEKRTIITFVGHLSNPLTERKHINRYHYPTDHSRKQELFKELTILQAFSIMQWREKREPLGQGKMQTAFMKLAYELPRNKFE